MIELNMFLLLGSVAVSLAGFASLLYSMQSEAPSRLFAWRVRYIVTGALLMAIASFAVVGVAQFTDDQDLIVRIAMVFLLLTTWGMSWSWRSVRDKEVFRSRAETVPWVIGNIFTNVVTILNLFWASVPLAVALWVFLVIAPTTIFINVVSTIYTPPERLKSTRS